MKKPIFIAIIIAVVATLWVLSGVLSNQEAPETTEPNNAELNEVDSLVDVRVADLRAEFLKDDVEITGRTISSRKITMRSETEGQVSSIQVDKGERVTKGQILAKLKIKDRGALVLEAEQLLNQRKIQFNAAKELSEKGFTSRVRLAEAKAQLESASAQLKQARVELANIHIKAPFDGIINNQSVEVGDFVSKGDEMFGLVDLDPLKISGFLTEQQIINLSEGSPATALIIPAQEVEGIVTFIASAADPDTRTFEMEMTLPNPDYKIKEGLTAKIKIPVQERKAYKVSPSILSLSDVGAVGVKTVNADNIVEFKPVRLLKDTPDHLWIGGLPDNIRLIIVGQDFVTSGQEVNPVLRKEEPTL